MGMSIHNYSIGHRHWPNLERRKQILILFHYLLFSHKQGQLSVPELKPSHY